MRRPVGRPSRSSSVVAQRCVAAGGTVVVVVVVRQRAARRRRRQADRVERRIREPGERRRREAAVVDRHLLSVPSIANSTLSTCGVPVAVNTSCATAMRCSEPCTTRNVLRRGRSSARRPSGRRRAGECRSGSPCAGPARPRRPSGRAAASRSRRAVVVRVRAGGRPRRGRSGPTRKTCPASPPAVGLSVGEAAATSSNGTSLAGMSRGDASLETPQPAARMHDREHEAHEDRVPLRHLVRSDLAGLAVLARCGELDTTAARRRSGRRADRRADPRPRPGRRGGARARRPAPGRGRRRRPCRGRPALAPREKRSKIRSRSSEGTPARCPRRRSARCRRAAVALHVLDRDHAGARRRTSRRCREVGEHPDEAALVGAHDVTVDLGSHSRPGCADRRSLPRPPGAPARRRAPPRG